MKSLLCLAFVLWWRGGAFADEQRAGAVDAESQEKVIQLLQAVIEHWNGSSASNGFGVTGVGIYTNVETAFRDASKLMPHRLDLRFGLASTLVGQASQTNGPQLTLKAREALQVYQDLQTLDTNGFAASILYAAYSRAMGETNASEATINELMSVHPQRTMDYLGKFALVDRVLELTPNDKPRKTMPKDKSHAIVIFGAALETNGTMKIKLLSRLQQGFKLARMYPKAPIILSGGNQKSGVTEAYLMSLWYMKKGISSQRLFVEDQAKDTVGNAVFSSAILQKLGVSHVTLVTSFSHIRRALVDLQEACVQRGLHLQYDVLAARSKADPELDPQQERIGTYRDLMRTSGLWAYPGLQR